MREEPETGVSEARDPICGMSVDPARALWSDRKGRRFFFCAPECRRRFEADTQQELSPAPPGAPSEWVCPMHPQIVRAGPGECPICGMALEPRMATLEEGENPELTDMRRRLWVSAVLTVPILLITMGEMLPAARRLSESRASGWIQVALATPVVLWAGWPFFVRAWRSIVNRSLNMFTLIGLGVARGVRLQPRRDDLPGLFPDSFRDHGQVAVYFEPAAVIVTLVLLGQVLELRARAARARRSAPCWSSRRRQLASSRRWE